MKKLFICCIIIFSIFNTSTFYSINSTKGSVFLVTFGKECSTHWGDDDFNQIFFISVPEGSKDFYIWLFDPDCGGKIDEINKKWNTQTLFELFGGKGAYTHADAKSPNPTSGLNSGQSLKKEIYAKSSKTDNKWVKWGPFKSYQGEKVGKNRIFKLVVKGISGDDGNLFQFDVSSSKSVRSKIENSRMFTYEVCFRYPHEAKTRLSINFVPDKPFKGISFYNFDGDSAGGVKLNTPVRRNLPLNISKNDVWTSKTYTSEPGEDSGIWSVNMDKPIAGNNDAVVYAKTLSEKPVSINLPLSYVIAKSSIVYYESTKKNQKKDKSSKCYTFDGLNTFKQYIGRGLKYRWDFGDGKSAHGEMVDYCYKKPDTYNVKLTVYDNKKTVAAFADATISWSLPSPPVKMEVPYKVQVFVGFKNKKVTFDVSRSYHPFHEGIIFHWDFGDGETAEGLKVQHQYKKPGIYTVTLTIKESAEYKFNIKMETKG